MLRVLLFLCFLLLWPLVSSANYEMTEAEWKTLNQNLDELQTINSKSQAALMSLDRQLAQSKRESSELKQESENLKTESTRLESQLRELRKISEEQRQSLLRANESLDQYAKEQKRKARKLKFQRNAAWACCLAAVIAAIAK